VTGLSRWHEVWSFGALDELPSEGFEGDILTGSEFAEQGRYGSAWEAAGDVLEHYRRDDADLLGHDMVHGQADHEVTRIAWPDELGEGGCQERVLEMPGRLLPKRDGWLPGSVTAQCHGVTLVQGVQEGPADRGLGSLRNGLGPRIPVGRNPGKVGFHWLILSRRGASR
jgi:hypothetical protein